MSAWTKLVVLMGVFTWMKALPSLRTFAPTPTPIA
jgi:hypothetical protein